MASAGASVAAVALPSDSAAGTVQITLYGNQITSGGPNSLSADITADGKPDLRHLHANSRFGTKSTSTGLGSVFVYNTHSVVVTSGTTTAYAFFGSARGKSYYVSNLARTARLSSNSGYLAGAGSVLAMSSNFAGDEPGSTRGLTPVTFSDRQVNGGALTHAFVEIRAFNLDRTTHTVQFVRTLFDDASTAPPTGVAAGVPYREFDPTVYSLRPYLAQEIARLKKRAKKVVKRNKRKAKRLRNRAKQLEERLAAIS